MRLCVILHVKPEVAFHISSGINASGVLSQQRLKVFIFYGQCAVVNKAEPSLCPENLKDEMERIYRRAGSRKLW